MLTAAGQTQSGEKLFINIPSQSLKEDFKVFDWNLLGTLFLLVWEYP